MTIPLDRLYQFIENTAEKIYGDRVIIYRFWPHGAKNLGDLTPLKYYSFADLVLKNKIICADQEPLTFEFYNQDWHHDYTHVPDTFDQLLIKYGQSHWVKVKNFRGPFFGSPTTHVVLHSEKRSPDVEKYQANQYQTVYYWSHAIMALDWFRYAEHIKQQKQVKKTFLIYNRAWSGTREYRLRIAELIIRLGLENKCKMTISPVEPELGIHYELHKFTNPAWRPNYVLENYFTTSDAKSHYSADFDLEDYEATDIEVVLETLFDDSRIQLTEKSLRPIALGQPFILAGPHGSLEYLRSYGFKTFDDIWDERYDLIEDPEERLIRIADLMKHVANWDSNKRSDKMAQAQSIADYNRQHFFSEEFFNMIVAELQENLQIALTSSPSDDVLRYINCWKDFLTHKEVQQFIANNKDTNFPTLSAVDNISKELETLYQSTLQ